jgi:hypothetical protein
MENYSYICIEAEADRYELEQAILNEINLAN